MKFFKQSLFLIVTVSMVVFVEMNGNSISNTDENGNKESFVDAPYAKKREKFIELICTRSDLFLKEGGGSSKEKRRFSEIPSSIVWILQYVDASLAHVPCDEEGNTPLLMACKGFPDKEMIDILLGKANLLLQVNGSGLNVNLRNRFNETPLHLLARSFSRMPKDGEYILGVTILDIAYLMFRLIYSHNADSKIKDIFGKCPADYIDEKSLSGLKKIFNNVMIGQSCKCHFWKIEAFFNARTE